MHNFYVLPIDVDRGGVIALSRPVHLSLGRVKTNTDGQKYGWTGKKNEGAKQNVFQNHSYC